MSADQPPGQDCIEAVAEAYQKFLETVATLTGIELVDLNNPQKGGLAGVCILTEVQYGHTTNLSNLPPDAQYVVVAKHLMNKVDSIDAVPFKRPN